MQGIARLMQARFQKIVTRGPLSDFQSDILRPHLAQLLLIFCDANLHVETDKIVLTGLLAMAKSTEQPRQIISTNCRAKPAVCLVLCCLVSTLSSQMLLLSCFAESCQRHSRGAGLRTSMKVLQRSRNNQQVRAQHRLERRLKFEETKSFSTGHDPQHLLMRLELMPARICFRRFSKF